MKTYTLNRAFRIVLRSENTPLRTEIFLNICERNRTIAFVYNLYSALPTTSLKACAILLYGVKCFLSLRVGRYGSGDILAAGTFVNEKTAVRDVQRLAEGLNIRAIDVSRRNIVSARSWFALPAFLSRARKLYRLCRRLARRYDFMPCCRSLSVIAYGIRLRQVLAPPPAAALIPSSYAPDSMALAFAAHKSGARVIYTNHAHIAPLFDYIAPVYADLSILTGRAVFETYARRSYIQGDIVYKGFASEESAISTRHLDDSGNGLTAGIFLTSLTDMRALEVLARSLIDELAVQRVVIRPHPVALVQDDYAGLQTRIPHVRIDTGGSLVTAAKDCDFVICGNSSAVLEVLKAGIPVAYDSGLDAIPEDYCGFVAKGLIPRRCRNLRELPRRLSRFYQQNGWVERMRYFDDSYGKSVEAVQAAVCRGLACCIR